MKILKQNPFFFSILGLVLFLYLTQGTLLPSDFTWPGINSLKANILDITVRPSKNEIDDSGDKIEFNSDIPGCNFHIYDKLGNIHCSSTYDIHVENIKRYLK